MKKTIEQVIAAAKKGAGPAARQELAVLQKLSAIDCGTGNEPGNKKVVEIIEQELRSIQGIEIERVYAPGFGIHLIARLRPENPAGKILLNAHMDTVFLPGDTAAHPYHEDGDTAYGLGIADCKGGVLVAIHAVKIMQQAGMLPNKEIVFLFNCDEEKGTPTGHAAFDKEIPGAEMAFVFEPARAENGVLTSRKGSCKIKMEVFGKKAHSGVNYLDGRSATVELAHKIMRLYESNDNERGLQFNVYDLGTGHDGAGTVAGYASASVSVRIASAKDVDIVRQILSRVESEPYLPDTKCSICIEKVTPPMERTAANLALYQRVYRAGSLLDQPLPEQSSGGSGDASYFSSCGVPTVDGLGPYMYQIHCTNEALRISSLEEKTCLFAVVLGLLDAES